MPITVVCPNCSARSTAPDAAAGKRVKCPKCGNPLTVPAQAVRPIPAAPALEVMSDPTTPAPPIPAPPVPAFEVVDDAAVTVPAPPMASDDDRPRPKRRAQQDEPAKRSAGVSVWAWVLIGGIGFLFLACGGGVGLLVWAPWKERNTEDDQKNSASEEALKRNAQDLQTYANNLKRTVPLSPGSSFNTTGLKAESYVMDDELGMFKVLVLKIEPVYLSDKITGQTKKYTRARLVRNNPPPARINPRTGAFMSFPEVFEWVEVEMLE